jgi:hypothetical protein
MKNIQHFKLNIMKKPAILFSLFIIPFILFSQNHFETKLKEISNDIAAKLSKRNIHKIVVLYITDIENKKTNTGKYIADMISYNIVNSPDLFQVFERENLSEIIEVKRLIDEGYIDAAKAKELGQILAVEAIIIGSYTVLSPTLKLSLKALDVNTGLVVAASMNDLPLDEECETNNTGDYCFENKTQYEVTVTISSGTITGYSREAAERFSIILGAGQSDCFYSMRAIPMNFYVVAKVNHGWTSTIIFSREGNIKVEKCKSKTFIIN